MNVNSTYFELIHIYIFIYIYIYIYVCVCVLELKGGLCQCVYSEFHLSGTLYSSSF